MPQPVQGIAGDSVVLECEPPRGHPEPQIRWKKNGQSLELDLDLGVDSDRYVNYSLVFGYTCLHVYNIDIYYAHIIRKCFKIHVLLISLI